MAKIVSEKYQIKVQDLERVGRNALIFSAPVLMIYISFVITNVQDGFSIRDFNPDSEVIGAIILWFLNAALDFLRKLVGVSTYKG